MRNLLVGVAVIAALVCLYVVANQIPSQALGYVAILGAAGAIGAAYVGHYIIRHRRLREWSRTHGRIDSCFQGPVDEGSQEYICTYLYSVNGTRQAGSFKFLARQGRFEEIRTALVGEVITVRFNPRNHTKSIVEESRIKDWDVA